MHLPPRRIDREFAYYRVGPGAYRVTLEVAGTELEQPVVLLEDRWYDGTN